jgi:1-acyl-sn-glycerol-3-phosphate acyltransferase
MLIYPEGTRFTGAKHRAGTSPFRHLLKPRSGGFATVLNAVRPHADAILDVAIFYPETTRFWQFLSGAMSEPVVQLYTVPIADVSEPAQWLTGRWQAKDQWLTECNTPSSPIIAD